ncbi:MAG TPA: glutathione S-transferase N-terminal domain-containing protein [Candidatus Binatia bacterium]|nr:glutathione S-transferase N-terminal domain-containing protein [Candidatus Binatia bacterium]
MDDRVPAGHYTHYMLWCSYYSGKMQAYLGYKEIPHTNVEPKWRDLASTIYPKTGIMKVPTIRTPDGQWMVDSTPMIDWFEQRFPAGAVVPEDAYQAFFCRLLEDYADEWLWRPALYYRWAFREDALTLSHRFAQTFLQDWIMPAWVMAAFGRRRQYRIYVAGDGVTAANREHVEQTYIGTLDRLEAILSRQAFLLGDKPSLVDFGFFASMFRHFSQDPTPSRIMHMRAPNVYAWLGRLWSARASRVYGQWAPPGTLPPGWTALLQEIGQTYLPYLHANAVAWKEKRRRLDVEVQSVAYRNLPVVQYRVWCRQELQRRHGELPASAREQVDATLRETGCLEPFLRDGVIESGLHTQAPPPLCQPRAMGAAERFAGYVTGTHWHTPRAFLR